MPQLDAERARVGQGEGRRGARRLHVARTEDPVRGADGRQALDGADPIHLEHAAFLHGGAPRKTWHRTRSPGLCTLLHRHRRAPADTRAFFPLLSIGYGRPKRTSGGSAMATRIGSGQHVGTDAGICGREATRQAREALGGAPATFGFLFASPDLALGEALRAARTAAGTQQIIGCTTAGELTER